MAITKLRATLPITIWTRLFQSVTASTAAKPPNSAFGQRKLLTRAAKQVHRLIAQNTFEEKIDATI